MQSRANGSGIDRRHGSRPGSARRPGKGLAGLLALLLLATGSCDSGPAAARGAFRIGVVLPFTSEVDQWATDVMNGLRLALPEGSGPIEWVERDDHGEPSRSADLVHELATQEGVDVIVGSLSSSCCLAAAERAEALGVPLITPSGTHEDITDRRRWVFRMCFTDQRQGEEMALFVRNRLQLENAAILKDVSNDYSLGLAEAFAETLLRNDGKIVDDRIYRSRRTDPEGLKKWLEGLSCDALYIPGYYVDVAEIIDATHDILAAREIAVLGGDGWESSTLRTDVKRWPQEVYFTVHFTPNNGDAWARDFVQAYREEHGEKASPSSFAALGYDTGLLLKSVLGQPYDDRQDLRDAISLALRSFHGATGGFEVNADTNRAEKHVLVLRGDGDAWVPVH